MAIYDIMLATMSLSSSVQALTMAIASMANLTPEQKNHVEQASVELRQYLNRINSAIENLKTDG
jgi:hypothetical protein